MADRKHRSAPARAFDRAAGSAARAALALWAAMALMQGGGAQAKTAVSIELVLAIDTSISIDGSEYDFLMNGIADAFRRPEIIDIIEQHDGVAVTLFQWNSTVDERYMIPWRLLRDRADILAFASEVEGAERDRAGGFTGIGEALKFGVRLIAENDFDGRQLKIDIAGDGRNNIGLPLATPHAAANALEIVINGLPILTYTDASTRGIDVYYRENVIHGPGAFIEVADDYGDFARAFQRKLLRELSPRLAREDTAPRGPGQVTLGRGVDAR